MTDTLPLSAPTKPLPAGACDTHAHVFGPFDSFPLPEGRTYTPPLRTAEAHADMLATLGFDRAVIVQASAYATDNRCTLDAIARNPASRRGIAVVDGTFDDDAYEMLKAGGMCGARFTEIIGKETGKRLAGAAGFDTLLAVAPKFREHGLHAQLFAPFDTLMQEIDALLALGVPLVLDHMARIGPSDRIIQDPDVQKLLALLREGRIWIKNIVFRNSRQLGDFGDVRAFHDAMIEANADNLVWGTDWPLLNFPDPPDPGYMLDLLDDWVDGDAGLRQKILVDNPARLYGF
ncbi:MAG: amidohydrolase family protein [Blastomonas sp.]